VPQPAERVDQATAYPQGPAFSTTVWRTAATRPATAAPKGGQRRGIRIWSRDRPIPPRNTLSARGLGLCGRDRIVSSPYSNSTRKPCQMHWHTA